MKNPIEPFDLQRSPLSGRNLVEASAGTGKTYTIEGVFLRLLLEKNLAVENILVVTFTEAATSELRERIRNKVHKALRAFETGKSDDELITYLLHEARDRREGCKILKEALAQFDEAAISTIHGFCHRELLDYAFESGSRFDSEFIKDQRELQLEIVQDFWRGQLYQGDRNWAVFLMERFGGPEKMLKRITEILSRPITRIVPDANELISGGDKANHKPVILAEKTNALFSELSPLWIAARDELEDILINHPGLDHRSYSKRYVRNWLSEMDGYFASGNPFLEPKNLFRFTNDTITSKLNGKAEKPEHPVFDFCSDLKLLQNAIRIQTEIAFINFVKQELKDRKQQRNVLSFDDLLKNLRDALNGPGGANLAVRIRKRYQVALIDEFQDTDPVQFEIFNTIFDSADQPLFFIGDPKQSIYSFRGADIFAYLEARKVTEHPYTLKTNWRSDGDLIRAINTIFSFRESPFLFSQIEFNETSGAPKNPERGLLIEGQPEVPFHLWYLDKQGNTVPRPVAERRVTKAVAGEIARLLNLSRKGKAVILENDKNGSLEQIRLAPEHLAVLVLKHKEAEAVQQALRKLSVPSVINTHASVFDTVEFSETVALLNAIADPISEKKIRHALTTSLISINGVHLLELVTDENQWDNVLVKFQGYRRTWLESGFYAMIRTVIRKEQVRVRLLKQEGGERKLTNFLHCLELLHEMQNNMRFGIGGLLKWAERQLFSDEKGRDETEIRLETDDRAVKIMTVHASKGLEFPVVFCPFAWGSRSINQLFFHDAAESDALTLDLGSTDFDTNKQQAKAEGLAEEIRLLYVALTRARHQCYMAWGNINQSADSAPAWLFHDGKPGDRSILDDLRELEERANGNIDLLDLPEENIEPYAGEQNPKMELQRLTFKGSKVADWRISSFTGLSSRTARNIEFPDRDQIRQVSAARVLSNINTGSRNMYSLPGGAKTGNCFHELFENLDFQQESPEKTKVLIRETLKRYDFEDHWQPVALDLVNNVLSTPLIQDETGGTGFSLNDVKQHDRLSEMEFYFPLRPVSSDDISNLLQPYREHRTAQLLQKTMAHLDFNEIPGFMKGFIDLICHHEGRYYILDWKTNFLGNQPDDYHHECLQEYMISHSFVLQYMIYTVALHRMLQLKLENYDFNAHFGGVFYIFLRGIQKEPQPDIGVYRDSLTGCGGMVESLSQYLGGDQGREYETA